MIEVYKYLSYDKLIQYEFIKKPKLKFEPLDTSRWKPYENTLEFRKSFFDNANINWIKEKLPVEYREYSDDILKIIQTDDFKQWQKKTIDKLERQHFKILCCSSEIDNAECWKKFSDCYNGIAIGLNVGYLYRDHKIYPHHVDYVNEEPKPILFDFSSNLEELTKQLYLELPTQNSNQSEVRFINTHLNNFSEFLELKQNYVTSIGIGSKLLNNMRKEKEFGIQFFDAIRNQFVEAQIFAMENKFEYHADDKTFTEMVDYEPIYSL